MCLSRVTGPRQISEGTSYRGRRLRMAELRDLASQDTADEFGVGMAPPPKIAHNSINVERRAVVSDRQGIAIVLKEKPTGCPRRSWHPCAAGIQSANAVHETIGSVVSVAADDDIGVAPS